MGTPEKKITLDTGEDESLTAPWISSVTKTIFDSKLRLHNEIVEFYQMIGPCEEDIKLRNTIV